MTKTLQTIIDKRMSRIRELTRARDSTIEQIRTLEHQSMSLTKQIISEKKELGYFTTRKRDDIILKPNLGTRGGERKA